MSGSKKSKYTIAKVLHWTAGFFIAFNAFSGWRLDEFEPENLEIIIMIHSAIGIIIFALMLLRWWWRRKHKLYVPPGWFKRPSMVLQVIFYPLLLLQVVIGVFNAAFINYSVRAFGLIDISALADANERLSGIFMELHGLTAITLIVLVLIHGLDRTRGALGG
jgi:cytochrome b561